MSEFSLNAKFNFNFQTLADISENAYPDIARLVYTGMSFNSDLDDILFLNSYFTQVFTKYYTVLEYLGKFNSRSKVQEYVDVSSAIIASTMEYFYRTNVDEALRFFANQFLKMVYDNTEFSVINIKLNSEPRLHTYKLVVEPISITHEDICEAESVEQFSELVIMLLSYADSIGRCVSTSIVKSDMWTNYSGKFPEIIDDNIFPGLFENYPAVYKVLFKSRWSMLRELGIDTSDLSEEITLSKEADLVYRNILEASKQLEYSNVVNVAEEIAEYSKLITDLYNKNINKSKVLSTNIKVEDLNLNHSVDMPVYIEILRRLRKEKFSLWAIQQLAKKEYGDGIDDTEDDEGDYLEEDLSNDEKDKLIDILNMLKNEAGVNLNIDVDEETTTEFDPQNFFTNLRVSETNPAKETKDGYQRFAPDYHPASETQLIYDLSDYISSTLNIYISNNGKINAPLIKKVVNSYNSCSNSSSNNIEIINVKNDKNQYVMEIKDAVENTFRFTISKKDGRIKYIENKKE